MIPDFLKLFVSFFKIGLFTFGGGYAMFPLMERELVEKHKWVTEQQMIDIFAVSQVTPGPIAINAATYIGYRVSKFWGSFFATLGVVLPSFVIILVIAAFLMPYMDNEWVVYAFEGIKVAVIVLMLFSVVKIGKADRKSVFYYIVLVASFIIVTFLDFNAIYLLLIALGVGIVYSCIRRKPGDKK